MSYAMSRPRRNRDIEYRPVGPGFLTLLGLLFIGLKLGKVITWSWWLVLLPIYGPLALVLAIGAFVAVVFGVAALIRRTDRKAAARRRHAARPRGVVVR